MKKLNLYYWIVTGIFAAFMIMSSVSNVVKEPEAVKMIKDALGYPEYIIPFLGVAKILGSIAILIPQFVRIKEWAYAGLFFDLVGALYSIIQKMPIDGTIVFMILPFIFLFGSYYLWHKKLEVA
ncbi:MAG: DoxX family protein [Spirosomaceae bacterium]|jgi:uncharacterized membrane protein|nr:DoxX family protein [Spirosomataceae bacterium]